MTEVDKFPDTNMMRKWARKHSEQIQIQIIVYTVATYGTVNRFNRQITYVKSILFVNGRKQTDYISVQHMRLTDYMSVQSCDR